MQFDKSGKTRKYTITQADTITFVPSKKQALITAPGGIELWVDCEEAPQVGDCVCNEKGVPTFYIRTAKQEDGKVYGKHRHASADDEAIREMGAYDAPKTQEFRARKAQQAKARLLSGVSGQPK